MFTPMEIHVYCWSEQPTSNSIQFNLFAVRNGAKVSNSEKQKWKAIYKYNCLD